MKGKIFPLNVDDRVGVNSGGRNMDNGGRGLKERGSYEDNSKERVTVELAMHLLKPEEGKEVA